MDQAAVDTLLYDIVCQERATMAPGARLYVVLGENHAMPSHKMAQAGLLDNLATAPDLHGRVMLAMEQPYNLLQKYLNSVCGIKTPPSFHSQLDDLDPVGYHTGRAVLTANKLSDAPQSTNRVLSCALSNNMPIALCDSALSRLRNLDPVDELALEIAMSGTLQCDLAKQDISMYSSKGINIRNAVMARRASAKAHSRSIRADTVVFQTGQHHLGGYLPLNNSGDLTYQTSLTARLKAEIRPQDKVLSIFFSYVACGQTPERAVPAMMWEDNPYHVVIRNLCAQEYEVYQRTKENDCIRSLGTSYLQNEFGGVIPARFQEPDLPSEEFVREEIDQIIGFRTI